MADRMSAAMLKSINDRKNDMSIGREEQKGGVMPEQLYDFLTEISLLEHIKVRGIMTIAPKTDDKEKKFEYFCKTYQYFIDISQKNIHNISMDILSMGMSDSFEQAVSAGSTRIRMGTSLFGERK